MKKFSTNTSVLVAFLNQDYLEATNYQESLWFNKDNLYSYNSLLAILDKPNSTILIDADIRNYSNTTAKQTSLFCSILPNDYTIFSHPLQESVTDILQWYWDKIEERILKHNKAYKDHSKEAHKHWIKHLLNESEQYIEYAEIDKRSVVYRNKNHIIKELFKHKIL